ncbi:MAG: dynamin family protein [Pseudomonadota bacterium]
MTVTTRKPRIALMGEFSSGKSTLSNLMLGARPLPEKVTATRVSPVWMSHGTQPAYRIDVNGTEEPVDIKQLETIDVDATRVIRLFFEADILEVCDLIDFPGISDPNMSSDVWQRMMDEVDAVLWCTHATQAWRQSESAVWDSVPDAVRQRSVLLVTKFDKLITERDRYRVLARLKKEAGNKFNALFPISLTRALAAGDDYEAFNASGGGAFLEHLIEMIEELGAAVGDTSKSIYETAKPATADAPISAEETSPSVGAELTEADADMLTADPAPDAQSEPAAATQPMPFGIGVAEPVIHVESNIPVETIETSMPKIDTPEPEQEANVVVPRRIRPTGGLKTVRPRRPAAASNVAQIAPERSVERPAAKQNPEELRDVFREA